MYWNKALTAVFGLVPLTTGLCAPACCAPPTKTQPPPLAKQVTATVEGGNRFACDLYQRLRHDDRNLFFSPASISMALAMAYAGAAENTEAEMAKVLHFATPKAQFGAQMRILLSLCIANDKKQGFRLDVANRLWGQEGEPFLPEFLRVTRADYGAELGRVDFRSGTERARQTINSWVLDHTGQKIAKMIPSAAELAGARLVLTNAVYFKGRWTVPFDRRLTKNAEFHISPDRNVEAPFMHPEYAYGFGYAHVEDLELLEVPYGDRSLSMIFLLPEKVGKLARLEDRLTVENLKTWMGRIDSQYVIVHLPKFTTTGRLNLSDTLRSMGMASAFDATANFSRMTNAKGVFLSAVNHEAHVDVNEEGTEAVAATTGAVGSADEPPPPPVFRADRPFVFLIRDNRTAAILFVGRIVDPTT
jgi:serpin B